MQAKSMKSEEARLAWRTVLDLAASGDDIVIERYSTPTAVLISYEDYVAILDDLEELRASRSASKIYEKWRQDPSSAIPWSEAKAQLTDGEQVNG